MLYLAVGLWVVELADADCTGARESTSRWIWCAAVMGVVVAWPLVDWTVMREFDKKFRNK